MIDEATFASMGDGAAAEAIEAEHTEGRSRRATGMALLLTELQSHSAWADAIRADIEVEGELLRSLLTQLDPGWPRAREALSQASALLEEEAQRCDARLAARIADVEANRPSREPSPDEEPDVVVRIWAARLREQADTARDVGILHAATSARKQAIIKSRKAFDSEFRDLKLGRGRKPPGPAA